MYEAAIQTWRADLRALTPPTRYTDVCLVYAFRRLGIPVQFTRNGPFWLFKDGSDMLLPFDLTIIHHDDKVRLVDTYDIRHQDDHFVGVRVCYG